jgi:hypothetical protein
MRKAIRANAGRVPQGRTFQFPAPVKGWMTQESPVDAEEQSALILDNFFPEPQGVRVRRGYTSRATGMTGNVESLLVYTSASASKLFAANDGNIYDVSSSGAVGAADISGLTNDRWQSVMMANSGTQYLYIVNGADAPRHYNGSAWATPAITGVDESTFINISLHKKRLWFTPVNSMSLWYLAVDAIAGAASEFPVGALFKRGGYVMATGTWSIDAGDGMDDLFVIITSQGEIALYAGTDPSSANTWELVGVYRVGDPIGRRCLLQVGADLAIMTEDGVIPISVVFRGDADRAVAAHKALTRNIREAWADAVQRGDDAFGWEMISYPHRNMALVNIPASGGELTWQFAYNTITGAWGRFRNQEANCWAVFDDELYFGGTDGEVFQADYGNSDDGVAITASMLPAYMHLGPKGRLKHVKGCRPIYSTDVPNVSPEIAIGVDYEFPTETDEAQDVTTGFFVWDSSRWDGTDVFYGYVVQRAWRGNGNIGTVVSPYMFIQIDETQAGSEFKFSLTGFDILFELGGVV